MNAQNPGHECIKSLKNAQIFVHQRTKCLMITQKYWHCWSQSSLIRPNCAWNLLWFEWNALRMAFILFLSKSVFSEASTYKWFHECTKLWTRTHEQSDVRPKIWTWAHEKVFIKPYRPVNEANVWSRRHFWYTLEMKKLSLKRCRHINMPLGTSPWVCFVIKLSKTTISLKKCVQKRKHPNKRSKWIFPKITGP